MVDAQCNLKKGKWWGTIAFNWSLSMEYHATSKIYFLRRWWYVIWDWFRYTSTFQSSLRWFVCRIRRNRVGRQWWWCRERVRTCGHKEDIDKSHPTFTKKHSSKVTIISLPGHLCNHEIREGCRRENWLKHAHMCTVYEKKYGWSKSCNLRTTWSWSLEILWDKFVTFQASAIW